MSNDSTTGGPAPEPTAPLPQFDPHAGAAAPPIAPPTTPYAYAALAGAAPASPAASSTTASSTTAPSTTARSTTGAPAAGSRWTAKKTAVTAGLALVLTSAGAIGAAAALPAGSAGDDGGFRGPGVGRSFSFPGGQQLGQRGQQGQGLQGPGSQQGTSPQQLPQLNGNGSGTGGLGALDPSQLGQLDPQQLLQQLQQGVDPFGGARPDHDDDGSSSGSGSGQPSGGTKTT
ncbi:hypothetical protein GCM10023258_07190 [Terrabacter aeriphilus]|uniref:Uncharacterized protein n=1 Tax=Terrabacter aeriphilus TaxID=515662 RepID=A0ABP9J3I5_9MICO